MRPSALSRTLSSIGPARAGRGLGDVVSGVIHGVSGVVHDASHVAHDVGHAVGDVLSGQLSKLPGDIVKTTLDVAKTGKDVIGVVPGALDPSSKHNSGDPSHSGGGEGGTQPRPPPAPGSGGGEGTAPYPSRPNGSQAPASTTPPESSTSPSSKYTAPASSTASNTVTGVANVGSDPSYVRPTEPMDPPAKTGAGREDGQSTYGVQLWSISSATPSSTTMDTLPSNGSGEGRTAHRKGFPLAAAAAIGSILGFLVVSALFWAVWLYLRNRRRAGYPAIRRAYFNRMLSVTTARTVSTVPLFISAREAGVKDENPFKHPRDAHEDDQFDAASLWRSSTIRSASTLSV